MNPFLKNLCIICCCCVGFSACKKSTDTNTVATGDYTSEIFSPANTLVYGNWYLFASTGGLHGNGNGLSFDKLTIKSIGKYEFNYQSQLETGKIVIKKQSHDTLLVSFVANKSVFNPLSSDGEKYLKMIGHDTLLLTSPCCDRYDYMLIRGFE